MLPSLPFVSITRIQETIWITGYH
uniref:Uncharacterized protein n=1 Tax=Arundo donax TaxID=35708 RepID=A0A0A9BSF0_ARUDO